MKEEIVERLLANVMDWTQDDLDRVKKELPYLQIMSKYKYDSYQRFYPGMYFIESLALWLEQFNNGKERDIAYQFIKKRLIFCSELEMKQLISMAYPDFIRPLLIKQTSSILNYPEYHINKITNSKEFKIVQRQSLFLGLSDGAHIDLFRRINRDKLDNEQIFVSYDISDDKAKELLQKLRKDICEITNDKDFSNKCYFKNLFLLDDFSGSGTSAIRKKRGVFKGKIVKVLNQIKTPNGKLSSIFDKNNLNLCIVLYMATEQAQRQLRRSLNEILKEEKINYEILVIQKLNRNVKINSEQEPDKSFIPLIEKYYDPECETESTRVGGTEDVKYGYAKCALPLVLSHNTPNNSIALLWLYDYLKICGLFPRVTRHIK